MRGLFLISSFFYLILGISYDYNREFDQVKDAVLKEMKFYSENFAHYFCPQGRPGNIGIVGMPGKTEREFSIDTNTLTEQVFIEGYECDVPKAVAYVLQKLEEEKIYVDSMPRGPPGFPGPNGRSSQEEMVRILQNSCFERKFNTTLPCLSALDVYLDIKKTFESPIECPNIVVGSIGKKGPMGKPGELPLKGEEMNNLIDQICPKLLE